MKRLILIIMIIMLTAEGCFEDERIGLFQLKSSYHSSGRSTFSSWGFYNDNCCEWEGVECSSSTGRLIHLFVLGDYYNDGNTEWKFNASLFFPFQQLTTLTLHYFLIGSCVQNQGFDRLSTLENLESLDLSGNEFKDINTILSSIGRISSLKSLSLNHTGLNSTTDIQDLVRLENLEVLDLSRNSFNNSIFSIVSRFSSLKSLSLEESALTGSKGFDMLSRLENLESLDLSDNYYNMDKSILSSISNISSLKSLYLRSNNGLNSTTDIQGALSKLVNLEVLDLSRNNFNNSILLSLASLSSLKTLDLSYNRLEGTIDLQGLSKLVNLEVLDLSYNGLEGTIDLQGFLGLRNLEHLDMTNSRLNNNILKDIEKMTSLKTLLLSGCELSGTLPTIEGLCNLRNLEELGLSSNELSGTLPLCIANLTSLQKLDLSDNHFIGSISPLRSLTSLQELRFLNNLFEVPLSLEPFFNHSNLKYLGGQGNHIIYEDYVEVHDSAPKFQLEIIWLSSHGNGNRNGGGFPRFLWHQHDLQDLRLSNIQLKGEFPYWLLENNTKLVKLQLANTFLSGPLHLPTHSHKYFQALHISNNDLNSTIPIQIGQILPNLGFLNLSRNGLVGGMPSSFGKMSSMLQSLDLSYNELSGEIPGDLEIGSVNKRLRMLDASNNHLSGSIPGWILNMPSLELLDLSENNFSKILPSACIATSHIKFVYLSRNMLQGSVGTAFQNFSELILLDLSHNYFSGTIPKWIGKLPQLSFLLMSHNNLEGEIPNELCSLEKLSLLDLSNNNFSGHVLPCLKLSWHTQSYFFDKMQPLEFTTKSITYSISVSVLKYMAGIDLSCNNFSGKIPTEIGNLNTIQVLNLSHNSLVGPIPESFSNLAKIESLDLSYNKLDGKIPSQLRGLNFLSHFSVAHNNLSGRTPEMVGQFATFENTSYEGNPSLCGLPLLRSCSPIVPPSHEEEEEEDGGFMDMEAFYASCVVSYVVVLLTIGAVLYVNPYWRRRWFYMIEVSLTNCYYFIEDHVLPLFKFRAS